MKPYHWLAYLAGNETAIRIVAQSRSALPVGFVFVLLAGIAREYDQTWLGDNWIRFLLPAFTSFIAAALIYFGLRLVLPDLRTDDEKKPIPHGGFRCFLALFWMTGPLAWVYAFPAEHFFPPSEAAWINIGLLAFVASARVLLLSHVLSVLMKLPFLRVLSSVLLITAPLMAIGSAMTSLSLMRMMGGLRHSPEESVLGAAASFVFVASIAIGVVALCLCISLAVAKRLVSEPLPLPTTSGASWRVLMILTAGFLSLLLLTQSRLKNSSTAETLMRKKDYPGFVAFLSSHQPSDFSPVKRLPPDVYEFHGLAELTPLIRTLNGSEAPWVREKCLSDLKNALSHDSFWIRRQDPSILLVFHHVVTLPEGKAWILANADLITRHFSNPREYDEQHDFMPTIKLLQELGLKIEVRQPGIVP